jgi:hypothetical protein
MLYNYYTPVSSSHNLDHFRRMLPSDTSFGVAFCRNVEVDDQEEPPWVLTSNSPQACSNTTIDFILVLCALWDYQLWESLRLSQS